jgi:hypothetical protein
LITSLPFVHTARRYYRLNCLVRSPDVIAATPRCVAVASQKLTELGYLEEVKVVTRFP